MKFSEKYGYTKARDIIQFESMDDALRNGLWSCLDGMCWKRVNGNYLLNGKNRKLHYLCSRLWRSHYKLPVDDMGDFFDNVVRTIRKKYFSCEWYEVYDFIEFVADNFDVPEFKKLFSIVCNDTLESEMSAYRLVYGQITQLTDKTEIDEIDEAVQSSEGPVKEHLRKSLEMMSDRSNPDYRNSIKESISAVESLVKSSTGEESGTLGGLINKLDAEISIHPALQKAFEKLYGYTSDEGGIRHSMTADASVDFPDAKFMLVTCSAFINFVQGKTAKTQTTMSAAE